MNNKIRPKPNCSHLYSGSRTTNIHVRLRRATWKTVKTRTTLPRFFSFIESCSNFSGYLLTQDTRERRIDRGIARKIDSRGEDSSVIAARRGTFTSGCSTGGTVGAPAFAILRCAADPNESYGQSVPVRASSRQYCSLDRSWHRFKRVRSHPT